MAICRVFSTVCNDHELKAAELCKETMGGDIHVSVSREISSVGLIELKSATILNVALYQGG